jgi:hypothetical protein
VADSMNWQFKAARYASAFAFKLLSELDLNYKDLQDNEIKSSIINDVLREKDKAKEKGSRSHGYIDQCVNSRNFLFWAKNLKDNLEILKTDLKLVLECGFEIIVAIDFFDLFEYCFPFANNLGSKEMFKNKFGDREFLNREMARHLLFYNLNNLYAFPVILLPPYIQERNNFFRFIGKLIIEYKNDKKREFILKIFDDIDIRSADGSKNLIKFIDKYAPELALIFSPCFFDGITTYKSLMDKKIRYSPLQIDEYINIILSTKDKPNYFLERKLNKVRPFKIKQNKNDAKAIQYTMEINKYLKESQKNKIIILVSSTHFLKIVKQTYPFLIDINDNKIHLLRDTDFLYIALLEIGSLIAKRDHPFDNNTAINLDNLFINVESHIKLIDNFLNAFDDATTGRMPREYFESFESSKADLMKKMGKLFCSEENLDIMAAISKFMPHGGSLEHLKPYSLENDIFNTLENIGSYINNPDFLDYIFIETSEIEREQILFLASMYDNKDSLSSQTLNEIIEQCEACLDKEINLMNNDILNILIENSVDKLREAFALKGINISRNAKIIAIYDSEWAIIDPALSERLYIIDNSYKSLKLHLIDLRFVRIYLDILIEKIERNLLEKKDAVGTFLVLKYLGKDVIPILDKIDYERKGELISAYHKIIDNCRDF